MISRLLPALVLVAPLFSQSVRTTVYSDLDGLASAEVLDLECAPDGSVWAVGRGGVSVFDGRTWTSTADRFAFPINDCTALDIDPQGRVWVGGEPLSRGIAMLPSYRRGVEYEEDWRRYPAPEGSFDDFVHDLVALDDAGDGRVLVALGSGRVLEFDGGEWRAPTTPESFGEVRGMWAFGGAVHFATSTGAFVRHPDGRYERLELPGLRSGSVYAMHVEGGGPAGPVLWVLGEDGLAVLEDGGLEVLEPDLPPQFFEVGAFRAVVRPSGRRVYYGTGHTLLRRLDGRSRVLTPADGLIDAGCTDVEVDRVGNTWISTRRGITRIPPPRFENLGVEDGLLGREVTALAELPDGSVIVGHTEGISRLRDGAVVETRPLPAVVDTPRRRVLDLLAEDTGDLWIASAQAGVTRVGADGELRSWPLPNTARVEGGESATSVVRDRSGTLWACGPGGLVRFEGGEPVSVAGRATAGSMRRLFLSPEGTVAAATLTGGVLLATADGGWRVVQHPDRPAANSVYAMVWTAEGELLVGTRAGLFVARGDRLERPAHGASLEGPVYFIQPDARGRLWAGTDRGVVRFDADGQRRYTIYEGLAGQETNRAASLLGRDGRLWFGTTGGLSVYREEEDAWAPGQASVTIGVVEVDGRRVDPDELREVPGTAALVFRLHTVSLGLEPRVRVRFRLLGYEDTWSSEAEADVGAIRYSRLPAGRYQLQVQASTSSGSWGSTTSSRVFYVPRPVWAQPWFLALAGLTTLGAAFGAARLRGTLRRTSRLTAELQGLEHSYRYAFSKSRAPQVLLEAGSHRVLEANSRARELLEPRGAQLEEAGLARAAGVDSAELSRGLAAAERDGDALFTVAAAGAGGRAPRRLELLVCAVELPGLDALQVTIQDVTERRRMEETLARDQRLKSLGRLAAGIAHDFNNLLTVILGQADLGLRRASSEEDVSEELRDILSAGERGAQLVRQLSAFGREQALEVEVLDLNAVLRDFTRMLGRLLGEDVRFDMRLAAAPLLVAGDRVELERVLVNLAANARDAMPGGGTIVVTTRAEGDDVVLTFADDGSGMSAEVRERAFEPFFTTKEESGGSGLGLATVYGVVQQSEGHVVIRSEPGRGTEVEVRLPRAESTTRAAPAEPAPVEPPPGCTRGLVLYVEDDDVVRAAGARMLRGLGFAVVEARHGLEALDILREGSCEPDILVTDISLPHFDGRALAGLVRRHRPQLPVLFVSGHVLEENAQERWGARARFLAKPFRAADLGRVLAELLAQAPPVARS